MPRVSRRNETHLDRALTRQEKTNVAPQISRQATRIADDLAWTLDPFAKVPPEWQHLVKEQDRPVLVETLTPAQQREARRNGK